MQPKAVRVIDVVNLFDMPYEVYDTESESTILTVKQYAKGDEIIGNITAALLRPVQKIIPHEDGKFLVIV